MDSIYVKYEAYVRRCLATKDLSNFKQHRDYQYMLEHVNFKEGLEYLDLLLKTTPISKEQIQAFCQANDAIGSPKKEDYTLFSASPTSLRYLYHAHLALSHFKTFASEVDIVEVGGGYGGLCAAVSHVQDLYGVKVRSYSIVDLPTIGKFQELYLAQLPPTFPVSFHSAEEYGATVASQGLFLISNYCFSEISNMHQKRYIVTLFPKVVHGFLSWNNIPVYDLGFEGQTSEPEVPKTGASNFYVRF